MKLINRLPPRDLIRIFSGAITRKATCVIKFYSDTCPKCHNIRPMYKDIAKKYANKNIFFYTYNSIEYPPRFAEEMGLKGVPSFCLVETGPQPIIKVLGESAKKDRRTYYTRDEIETFIDRHVDFLPTEKE